MAHHCGKTPTTTADTFRLFQSHCDTVYVITYGFLSAAGEHQQAPSAPEAEAVTVAAAVISYTFRLG